MNLGFFAALASADAETLRSRGTKRRFARGTTLFLEGDTSDRVFVITKGRVKICSVTRDGREIVLAVRGPGDVLGDLSAIDGEPRSASASALEPLEALVLPAADFREFLERSPQAAFYMLRSVTAKLRDADRKRVEFGAHETVGRVAGRLAELAEQYGEQDEDGIRIALPLSQEELAGWTGASREAVAKSLRTLRERGWITTHRRGVTVRDLDALRRRAL